MPERPPNAPSAPFARDLIAAAPSSQSRTIFHLVMALSYWGFVLSTGIIYLTKRTRKSATGFITGSSKAIG